MSRTRATYRQPRDRGEVIAAVLGVLAVLAFTGIMVWILAPNNDAPTLPTSPIVTAPTPAPTDTAVPASPDAGTPDPGTPDTGVPDTGTPADTTPATTTP